MTYLHVMARIEFDELVIEKLIWIISISLFRDISNGIRSIAQN